MKHPENLVKKNYIEFIQLRVVKTDKTYILAYCNLYNGVNMVNMKIYIQTLTSSSYKTTIITHSWSKKVRRSRIERREGGGGYGGKKEGEDREEKSKEGEDREERRRGPGAYKGF